MMEESREWACLLPSRLDGLVERRELPSGVRGEASAANDFGAFWALRTMLVALKISYSGNLVVEIFCVSAL
jgi:hypothetical protein